MSEFNNRPKRALGDPIKLNPNPAGTHHRRGQSTTTVIIPPKYNDHGRVCESKSAYSIYPDSVKTKSPLLQECERLGIRAAKRSNLASLREHLLAYWYPISSASEACARSDNNPPFSPVGTTTTIETPISGRVAPTIQPNCSPSLDAIDPLLRPPPTLSLDPVPAPIVVDQQQDLADRLPPVPNPLSFEEAAEDLEEQPQQRPQSRRDAELVSDLGLGEEARTVLEFDPGVDFSVDKDVPDDEDEGIDSEDDEDEAIADFEAFKKKTRMDAAARAEGNRRAGGLRTQRGLVKAWKEWVDQALKRGEIQDDIVDEHSLLLFVNHCATRCKRTAKGIDIPGTLVGASQIKKHFFSVLRVRKEQEAADPTLRHRRPAVSVHVWDAVKCRMDEAVKRVRSGMVGPNEDAPDIILNTFLDRTTEDEFKRIGIGFLSHRELRCAINGHLAWTVQNATGNRGDDVRALKISELQPYEMLHPNNITSIFCVLGLQGEEKAGLKGMQSRINPVYSVLIAAREPERDPLGALAIYFHYIFDVRGVAKEVDIDWSLNKTWRQVRVLFGKDPKSPFGSQNLYNLFVKAFARADFSSKIKQHFPRHLLPYKQRELGVAPDETSKMGWKRGQTYHDVYAPALPKSAILAAHGYKESEVYDPLWTKIHVPDAFLKLVCPMAEEIINSIKGQDNLRGATSFWEMVITLRPYLFQSAAAIYKVCPTSPIFKLPALASPDVQKWMREDFQEELSQLQSENSVAPILDERVTNSFIGQDMQKLCAVVSNTQTRLEQLHNILERRTSFFSPSKGFSVGTYTTRSQSLLGNAAACESSSQPTTIFPLPPTSTPATPPRRPACQSPEDHHGSYPSSDSGFRAFVSDSPQSPQVSRPRTQVDLVLPPLHAWSAPGAPLTFLPPVLGHQGVRWHDILNLVKQPDALWENYSPRLSLDGYKTVENLWALFAEGELVVNAEGVKTGMNPPLHLLEAKFQNRWRPKNNASARKKFERFREIPDWISAQSRLRGVPHTTIIEELEQKRKDAKVGLNGLTKIVKSMREEAASARRTQFAPSESTAPCTATNSTGSGAAQDQPIKKKRRAPVDSRRPSKQQKIGSDVGLL